MSNSTSRLEGLTSALAVKTPCRAATTGNITLIGLQTIDGVPLAAGDRVLVRAQTNSVFNGIYNADTGGWTRARDFDGVRDVTKGTMVFVTDGTAHGASFFTLDTANPVAIGTDALTFTKRSSVTGDIAAAIVTYANGTSGLAAVNVQAALDELANKFLAQQGSNIASAATTNIGGGDSDFVRVTGTTTITSLGSTTKYDHVWVKFTGILTLTHNATSLILPGGANITTAVNDIAEFVRISGSNWQCIAYHRANGLPVPMATQAQAQAGLVDTVLMTPLRVAQAIAALVADVTEADIDSGGAAAGEVITADGVGGATFELPPFSKSYTSSDQTITAAGPLTLAHGMGTVPKHVSVFLKNTTADQGYSVGDVVQIYAGPIEWNPAQASLGVTFRCTATEIQLRMGASAGVFAVLNFTTGAAAVITSANWRLVVRAWA